MSRFLTFLCTSCPTCKPALLVQTPTGTRRPEWGQLAPNMATRWGHFAPNIAAKWGALPPAKRSQLGSNQLSGHIWMPPLRQGGCRRALIMTLAAVGERSGSGHIYGVVDCGCPDS